LTDQIFNLQVRLVADDDRGQKQNKKLIEDLVGKALKQVIPEAMILKVNFTNSKKGIELRYN
jgi:hypothetical protein